MKLKTKEGKYFSDLGSWKGLVEIAFLVLVFKLFGIIPAVILGSIIFAYTHRESKK